MSFGTDVRIALMNGTDKLADAVAVTLGPKGRFVIIDNKFGLTTTKDGVTVTKQIKHKDANENLAAMMIREAAEKTNSDTGDGTTTATVLTQAMVREVLRLLKLV